MKLRTLALAGAISLLGANAWASCAFQNPVPIRSLTAGFEAWKVVTSAMAECGNFSPVLDQEFGQKQPPAFAANPALYQIGGVSNGTLVPLLRQGTVRPLDELIAKHGQHLKPNQLIKIDGKTTAVAMMINAQHLMYREDILNRLGIAVPTNYDEVLAAAEKIKKDGAVPYPIGGTYQTGFNLAQEFVNMYAGYGGEFFTNGAEPAINNEKGAAALDTMKKLTAYMDPEYLASSPTYVQQQFQQGKIALANLWSSRAGAMDDPKESQVAGKVKMAAAPAAVPGGRAATTIWWDGIVIAKNIPDADAEAAFRVAMEGLDKEMVKANNAVAVWLIEGYEPGPLAKGVVESAQKGAVPYPSNAQMGLMQTALGSGLASFLTGQKDAKATLTDIEAAYRVSAKEAGLIR
jgi:ABC-type glycerol-3-phosphate transport system substrate-binding protein